MPQKKYTEGPYRRIRQAPTLRATIAANADDVPGLRPLPENLVLGQQGKRNPVEVRVNRFSKVRGLVMNSYTKIRRMADRRKSRKAREQARKACLEIEAD